MLSEKDKELLELLRTRVRVKVSVDRASRFGGDGGHTVEVALLFVDDEGEKHEIDSDQDDLPRMV